MRTQREKFDLTVPAKPKARECADLLLLSVYMFIPPSRGLEIRTLEIVGEEESLEARKDTARNLLIQMANGDIKMHFSNFKTRKFVGRDELALGVRTGLLVMINLTRRLLWFFAHCSVRFARFLFRCRLHVLKTSLHVAEMFSSCFSSIFSEGRQALPPDESIHQGPQA